MSTITESNTATPDWVKRQPPEIQTDLLEGPFKADYWAEQLWDIAPIEFVAGLMCPALKGMYIVTEKLTGPGWLDQPNDKPSTTGNAVKDKWLADVETSRAEARRLGVSWTYAMIPMPPSEILDPEINRLLVKHHWHKEYRARCIQLVPGEVIPDFAHMNFVREFGGQGCAIYWKGNRQIVQTIAKLRTSYPDIVVPWRNEDGEQKDTNIVDVWLKHSKTRRYEQAEFLPGAKTDNDTLNLWRGWALPLYPNHSSEEPKECRRFLDHMFEILCGGKGEYYDYLLHWVADIFHNPMRNCQTSVAIIGDSGAGKDFFFKSIGSLMAPHYKPLNDKKQLLGNFNAMIKDALLLNVSEGFFGSKADADKLKYIVSEGELTYEHKGLDSQIGQKYFRIGMTSNRIESLYIEEGDRRNFVLEARGGSKNNDPDYHQPLRDEWNLHGGNQAFFNWMMGDYWKQCLEEMGSKINVRPETALLHKQRTVSLNGAERAVYNLLWTGSPNFPVKWGSWDQDNGGFKHNEAVFIPTTLMQESCRLPDRDLTTLGTILSALGTKARVRLPNGHQCSGVWLPGLEQCRASWDAKMRAPTDWSEGADDWAGDGGEQVAKVQPEPEVNPSLSDVPF